MGLEFFESEGTKNNEKLKIKHEKLGAAKGCRGYSKEDEKSQRAKLLKNPPLSLKKPSV
jgi:hypothetical protein